MVADFYETVLPVLSGNEERAWRNLLFRYIYQFCEKHRRLASSRPDNIPILFTIMNGRIRELERRRSTTSIEDKYRITARSCQVVLGNQIAGPGEPKDLRMTKEASA